MQSSQAQGVPGKPYIWRVREGRGRGTPVGILASSKVKQHLLRARDKNDLICFQAWTWGCMNS